ncbi:MAG TPA: phage holin family protein [Terriglobales bacterium]|nr:phage holin family protein [Terriglobales bacterium]
MPDTRHVDLNGRSLGEVISEIKEEVKEFFQTRVSMFVAEMREKVNNSKTGAIYAGIALALGWVGFIMLSLALAALVAVAFWGSPYAWFFGFLIVGFLWTSLAAMLVLAAVRQFRDLVPKRTIQVLKEDKIWLQHEAEM